jgi:hypothetical protein
MYIPTSDVPHQSVEHRGWERAQEVWNNVNYRGVEKLVSHIYFGV